MTIINAVPTKQLELAIANELKIKDREVSIAELLDEKKDEDEKNVDRPTS